MGCTISNGRLCCRISDYSLKRNQFRHKRITTALTSRQLLLFLGKVQACGESKGCNQFIIPKHGTNKIAHCQVDGWIPLQRDGFSCMLVFSQETEYMGGENPLYWNLLWVASLQLWLRAHLLYKSKLYRAAFLHLFCVLKELTQLPPSGCDTHPL